MRALRLWLLALGVILSALGARAQDPTDDPDALSAYAKGLRLLRDGNYLDASRSFHDLSDRFTKSPNRDLFLFNAAKADYHLGDLPKANVTFDELLKQYPETSLKPYARFFQGNILYSQGRVERALSAWLADYASAQNDDRLADLIRASITTAVLVDDSRLSLLRTDTLEKELRCDLARHISESLIAEKRFAGAQAALALCPDSQASRTSAIDSSIATQNIEIAMVLPFSGDLQSYGEEIFQGATIAAEQYSVALGRSIRLTPYDTKADPIEAARIIRDLERSSVLAAIGPLTSEESGVVSAANGCGSLPIVIPAATEAGLTQLSQTAFQLSPNIELQGIAAADYAVAVLKADTAAIISASTSEFMRLCDAFAARFKQLGGTIAAVQYYRTRDKDFGPYLRDVKLALRGHPLDSAAYVNQRGDTLEDEGIPASVDCLFLPGDADHLRTLLPQLNFYGISGQYLGTDGWGDETVYRLGVDVTKQAVFSSPFLVDEKSEAYIKLKSAFDTRFSRKPQRLASLGFDAVAIIARVIGKEGISRHRLVAQMAAMKPLDGAAGRIVFGTDRENVAMPMYKIRDGLPVSIGVQNISVSTKSP